MILSTAERKSLPYYVWRTKDTENYPTKIGDFLNIDKKEITKLGRATSVHFVDVVHLMSYALTDIVYIFEFNWEKLSKLENFDGAAFFKVWGEEMDDDIRSYLQIPKDYKGEVKHSST